MAQQSSSFNKKRKADASTKSSSVGAAEQSAKSQKRALKQERQLQRKHADVVIEAKKIWNQLRLKTNTKEEVKAMASRLVTLTEGKVQEIALQHDASRVVQAALQFGNAEERRQVLKELTNASLLELSKNQYAHFVVLKSIKYCASDKESVKMIVKVSRGMKLQLSILFVLVLSYQSLFTAMLLQALKGNIPKLAVHATGSKTVEALFQSFPNKSTAVLQQEFYGPHFALFAADVAQGTGGTPTTLATHLSKSPDKKEAALSFIKKILEKGIEKSLFGYQYYQDLFAEYMANAPSQDIRQMAPSVVDHSVHLLSSKAGTRVVAACAAYGTAKDRKRILKSLKGFSKSALLHRDAYLAVLRLVQVTDDTVSTQKNVFNELLTAPTETEEEEEEEATPPLLEVALHDQASKLFLMLLATDEASWKKVFDPYELELLDPNPTVTENGEEVPTRKKDHERHRQELLQHLQKPLMELSQTNTRELMFSLSGSALIREIYNTWHSNDLVQAVVEICESELEPTGEGKEGDLPLFEDRVGQLAIKNLILCDVEVEDGKGGLAKAFFEKLQDRLMEIAQSNRGAFVVAALCKVPSVRAESIKKLKKKTGKLKELADKGKATAGFKALLKEIEG